MENSYLLAVALLIAGVALMLLIYRSRTRRRRQKLILDTESFPPPYTPGLPRQGKKD